MGKSLLFYSKKRIWNKLFRLQKDVVWNQNELFILDQNTTLNITASFGVTSSMEFISFKE